jgi:anti-sigma factor RsiW
MNCSEAEHFFDAYLDGELAGSLRLEFDAHRLRCGVCQQKLAMMEACEHILARDGRGPLLSDDFTDRVMDEVEQRRVITLRSRKRRIVWGTAVGVQAAAVIAFAFLWAG